MALTPALKSAAGPDAASWKPENVEEYHVHNVSEALPAPGDPKNPVERLDISGSDRYCMLIMKTKRIRSVSSSGASLSKPYAAGTAVQGSSYACASFEGYAYFYFYATSSGGL